MGAATVESAMGMEMFGLEEATEGDSSAAPGRKSKKSKKRKKKKQEEPEEEEEEEEEEDDEEEEDPVVLLPRDAPLQQRLIAFYAVYNPGKRNISDHARHVAKRIAQGAHSEEMLNKGLAKKYGADLHMVVDPKLTVKIQRERMRAEM